MTTSTSSKIRIIIEMIGATLLFPICKIALDALAVALNADGLWVGVLNYLLVAAAIIAYVVKVDKKPVVSLGLMRPVILDIPKGLLLGFCMFVVQQIPLLLMKMDYSGLAEKPDWGNFVIRSLYIIFCVGLVEELLLRGFIRQKTEELCGVKAIVVVVNCLLFYAIHMPPVRFVFGEFFNIATNTLFLCIYFYRSKSKSLSPLIIAHGFYDILTSYLLPAFLFYSIK